MRFSLRRSLLRSLLSSVGICLLYAGSLHAQEAALTDPALWAEQVAEAQVLEESGALKQSLALLKSYADAGNGLAQFSYAWRIKEGFEGIVANPVLACTYFIKSAQLNIPVGAQEAGHCYRDGLITAPEGQQKQLAEGFYQTAIENGMVASFCDIAELQQTQTSVKLNQLLAQCEQVAAQGALYAQEILVDIYSNTKGAHNNEKAIYWLEVAAEKSAKSAYRYALTLHESGQIKPELTRYYFESAASKGYVAAYLETAALYFNASNAETNDEKAGEFIAKAYLWSKAWQRRNPDIEIPNWVTQIDQQVPKQWKGDLDLKVNEHVSLY